LKKNFNIKKFKIKTKNEIKYYYKMKENNTNNKKNNNKSSKSKGKN
jgi:hypothetical protein